MSRRYPIVAAVLTALMVAMLPSRVDPPAPPTNSPARQADAEAPIDAVSDRPDAAVSVESPASGPLEPDPPPGNSGLPSGQEMGSADISKIDPLSQFPAHLVEFLKFWGNATERFPPGCRTPWNLVHEMFTEHRDTLWAERMESALRSIWLSNGRTGVPISVSCHATICQVSAHTNPDAANEFYWKDVLQDFLASEAAAEFTRWTYFGGGMPGSRILNLWVLISLGNDASDEPEECGNIPGT